MIESIFSNLAQWILGIILILASLGVILAHKPVIASLYFLVTLITLAALYLQLSAQFIAIMQILVYAGAILVIFMFVIVLFQDAYQQISRFESHSSGILLFLAASALIIALGLLGNHLKEISAPSKQLPESYGTVETLGRMLYLDFFFPFEAVIFLFLIAMIGALYIGKKVR